METVIEDLRREITEAREAERQALLRSNEARLVLEAAKEELAVRNDDRLKLEQLAAEVAQLRARNKSMLSTFRYSYTFSVVYLLKDQE